VTPKLPRPPLFPTYRKPLKSQSTYFQAPRSAMAMADALKQLFPHAAARNLNRIFRSRVLPRILMRTCRNTIYPMTYHGTLMIFLHPAPPTHTDGRTDRRTDGRTGGRMDVRTDVRLLEGMLRKPRASSVRPAGPMRQPTKVYAALWHARGSH